MQSIQELVSEVVRQTESRRDFIAPVRQLAMKSDASMQVNGSGTFALNAIGHEQLAEYIGVPREYYKRIQEYAPDLLASNVNRWMADKQGDRRLVRTLDGKIRAVLSDRYRCLDNVDLMNHLVPVLMDRPDLSFRRAEITERRFYLQVVSDELKGEIKPGDEVRMGLIISNSETGNGSLSIFPFSDRLVCANGAVHTSMGQRRAHLGRALGGADENVTEYISDEAKQAEDRAFFLKARDVVKAILSGDVLQRLLADMRASAEDKLEGDPEKVVEVVGRNVGLSETERVSVLRNLIDGKVGMSRWGLANAITAAAHTSDDFDRAVELQTIGGRYMSEPLPVEVKPQRVRVKRRELVAV
jgi:hypothetical protein